MIHRLMPATLVCCGAVFAGPVVALETGAGFKSFQLAQMAPPTPGAIRTPRPMARPPSPPPQMRPQPRPMPRPMPVPQRQFAPSRVQAPPSPMPRTVAPRPMPQRAQPMPMQRPVGQPRPIPHRTNPQGFNRQPGSNPQRQSPPRNFGQRPPVGGPTPFNPQQGGRTGRPFDPNRGQPGRVGQPNQFRQPNQLGQPGQLRQQNQPRQPGQFGQPGQPGRNFGGPSGLQPGRNAQPFPGRATNQPPGQFQGRQGFTQQPGQRGTPGGFTGGGRPFPSAGMRPDRGPSNTPMNLRDLRNQGSSFTRDGGRTRIIQEPGNRMIIRQDGRAFIRNDDRSRFSRFGQVQNIRNRDGGNTSIIRRPDGSQVISVFDGNGRLIERRCRHNGREFTLFSSRLLRGAAVGGLIAAPLLLAPLAHSMPRDRYIVDYEAAPPQYIDEALSAPPVQRLERTYSVEEVLRNGALRDRMRRIDLDAVNFASGSWEVPDAYRAKLSRIAQAMLRMIQRNPKEVFLIEGHTDATGTPEDNLTLSDRRAEAIAIILTQDFGVPPENLLQQGYGQQFLKVSTQGPEARNRRVTIRRVTPLLASSR